MNLVKLLDILNQLPKDQNIQVVTGEDFLPERLVDIHRDHDLLFMQFDNAPDEGEQTEEGRGFVDHEIELLRLRLEQIVSQSDDKQQVADALLGFFLIGHEASSSEFVELLENMDTEAH
ncbi:hypothetical protein [Vibrio hippocampi]|uniref:Uncharacterized protein n=1 Tax=Vibrio hippocampi TaxID=654686 RepID=A0ABN8DFC7_9VIBR|nr:hypothetical protein [Vibrio hippocampi]CAH0525930.1 hypothetical protein VHP8226_01412 [Vibrio hippocampi]